MSYLIFVAFWVFLGRFERFWSFDRWKVEEGKAGDSLGVETSVDY